jgi:hypothetical protein
LRRPLKSGHGNRPHDLIPDKNDDDDDDDNDNDDERCQYNVSFCSSRKKAPVKR